jgi:hypothetical protein
MEQDVATLDLGNLYATPGALKAFAEAEQTPLEFLGRHMNGDWGRGVPGGLGGK